MPTPPENTPDGPVEPPSARRQGFFAGRSRRSRLLRGLATLAALAGVGLGGWWAWRTYADHRDHAASVRTIHRACAGLVDPDAVLEMRGGTVRVKAHSEGMTTPDLGAPDDRSFKGGRPPGSCEIYRAGRPGTAYNHFRLGVTWQPASHLSNLVSGTEESDWPFADSLDEHRPRDHTRRVADALPQPVGPGARGTYTTDSVTMTTPCTGGRHRPDDHRALQVYAGSPPKRGDESGSSVSDADRGALAGIATQATRRAARQLGCHTPHLAAPAHRLAKPRMTLGSPGGSGGTCAWYARFVRHRGRAELPDRALGTRKNATAREESCLLGVSPRGVRTAFGRHRKLLGDDPVLSREQNVWGIRFEHVPRRRRPGRRTRVDSRRPAAAYRPRHGRFRRMGRRRVGVVHVPWRAGPPHDEHRPPVPADRARPAARPLPRLPRGRGRTSGVRAHRPAPGAGLRRDRLSGARDVAPHPRYGS